MLPRERVLRNEKKAWVLTGEQVELARLRAERRRQT